MDVGNAAAPPEKKKPTTFCGRALRKIISFFSLRECGSSTLVNEEVADTGDGIMAGTDEQAAPLTLSPLGDRLRSPDRPSGVSTTYTLLDGTAPASS